MNNSQWMVCSSRNLLNYLSDYIFCWNEDHINVNTIDEFNNLIEK